ncbi:MAG: hypothetical protein JXA07_07155 [Spirochaetes bacterium]|nr:hypothetical protein [Spirochaetota bacterium]
MKKLELQPSSPETQAFRGGQKHAGVLSQNPKAVMNALSSFSHQQQPWISGVLNTACGLVPVVSTEWSSAERRGRLRSRISAFRDRYAVRPGLYAVGAPDSSSDIFVSANYKLSFDILRRSLAGMTGWILVLDTKGINVWCAAGKGTFGTAELAKRVLGLNIAGLVTHSRLILPQLGATGVNAAEVRKKTGFTVRFGPVNAKDIPAYVRAGYRATPAMRTIRFTLADRLVLTPMEVNPALRRFPLAALVILAIFGLQPSGIIFKNAWTGGWPFLVLCLTGLLAGTLVTPAFLPVIPFRSFALKGLAAGAAVIAPLVLMTPLGGASPLLDAAAIVLFPLVASYLALQFTGSTTFTTISGVKKELKFWLPVYIAGIAVSLVLIIIHKLESWGLA